MRWFGRKAAALIVFGLVVGVGVAVAQEAPEQMPQDQASCEAAGYIWVQDPDGRDQMVCLYVDNGDAAPPSTADGAGAGAPAPDPSTPAPPSAQRPDFTG